MSVPRREVNTRRFGLPRIVVRLVFVSLAAFVFVLSFGRRVGDGLPEGKAVSYIKLVNTAEQQFLTLSGHYGNIREVLIDRVGSTEFQKRNAEVQQYYRPMLRQSREGYVVTLLLRGSGQSFSSDQTGSIRRFRGH